MEHKAENLLSQEKVLKEELAANTLQVQHLDEELGLWKAAADMAFDQSHPEDFFLQLLNKQVDAKECDILELESQWYNNIVRNNLAVLFTGSLLIMCGNCTSYY